jgi:biotin--protein ligase
MLYFPGKCIGPVFPGFKYGSEEGTHAAKVIWMLHNNKGPGDDKMLHTYFNGGGAFVDNECDNRIEIIARYASVPENSAAVLKCKVGAGMAVLSGVHFEYLPQDLQVTEGSPLVDVVPKLLASRETSIKFFKSVLNQLSVC